MTITLHQALKSCNIVQVEEILMKDNREINVLEPQREWSPLYKAVLYRDLKLVNILLKYGANPNLSSAGGESPLHIAVENNLEKIAERLLENKADPNKLSNDGDSPLHIATEKNLFKIVEILIKYGANMNLPNKHGKTSINLANDLHHTESLLILLEKKADHFDMPLPAEKQKEVLKEITNEGKYKNFQEFLEKEKITKIAENLEKIEFFRNSVSQPQEKSENQNFGDNLEKLKEESSNIKNLEKEGERGNNELNNQEKVTNINDNEEVKKINEKELESKNELLKKEVLIEEEKNCENKNEQEKLKEDLLSNRQLNEEEENFKKPGKDKQEELLVDQNSTKLLTTNDGEPSKSDIKENYYEQRKGNLKKFEEAIQRIRIEDIKKSIPPKNLVFEINLNEQNEEIEEPQILESLPNQNSISQTLIEDWLKEINLSNLLQNFLDNSIFDSKSLAKLLMNNTKNWDKYLITHFGIDKPGYRKRIIIKLKEDLGLCQRNGLFKLKQSKKANLIYLSIQEWLRSLNLDRFLINFEEAGYDDYESLVFQMSTTNCLTDQSLREDLGVNDKKAREIILNQLNEDAIRASQIKVPEDFEGEISFEINGKTPGSLKETCSIF